MTILFHHQIFQLKKLLQALGRESQNAPGWFTENNMTVNPDKFQEMIFILIDEIQISVTNIHSTLMVINRSSPPGVFCKKMCF